LNRPLDYAGKIRNCFTHCCQLKPIIIDIMIIFDEQRRHGKGIAKVYRSQGLLKTAFGGGMFFFFLVSDFCGGNLLNLLIFWEFSEAYVFLWLVDY
jgi:hypothetical protein